MKRTIEVHIGEDGTPLGTLRYDQQGARESAAFEYAASWLANAERFAIEPGLPLTAGPQFHRKTRDGSAFHAALGDTEPDGWGKRVIQRDYAKRRQQARREGLEVATQPLNAMDYLLAVDDVSRVGALRLRDEEGRYRRLTLRSFGAASLSRSSSLMSMTICTIMVFCTSIAANGDCRQPSTSIPFLSA